jgi:hypothetical protein
MFATLPSGQAVNSAGNVYNGSAEDANIGVYLGFIAWHNRGADTFQIYGVTPATHEYTGTITYEIQ